MLSESDMWLLAIESICDLILKSVCEEDVTML